MTIKNGTVRKRIIKDIELLRFTIEQDERTWRDFSERYCTVRFKKAKEAQFAALKKAIHVLTGYVNQH